MNQGRAPKLTLQGEVLLTALHTNHKSHLRCSEAISSSARLHWGWIQNLGIRSAQAQFHFLSFYFRAVFHCCTRCPPVEELYDSMRSGVLLCQVHPTRLPVCFSRALLFLRHLLRQIVNKLERREFVTGVELRPKARAQYIHNCKRWAGDGAVRVVFGCLLRCSGHCAVVFDQQQRRNHRIICSKLFLLLLVVGALCSLLTKRRRALEALRQNKKVPVWRLWSEEVCGCPCACWCGVCVEGWVAVLLFTSLYEHVCQAAQSQSLASRRRTPVLHRNSSPLGF